MTFIGAALPIFLSALTLVSPSRAARAHNPAGTPTPAAVAQGPAAPAQGLAATVRRVAATATLAAQEYRIGVVGGSLVAAAEVEEARLFLE
ncbi:MAG TPA: hypothetical protein VHG35_02785, partial [Gemmatimonadales bacterium]|nr:hypothetical protein [Gemmatimonadales bacterium]